VKELNCRFEVIDDDSYVIHPLERHVSNLQAIVEFKQPHMHRRGTTGSSPLDSSCFRIQNESEQAGAAPLLLVARI
jgi:hypothetical protein